MGSSEETLSQDAVFDILSNPRRRYVLYYLRQESEPIELTTLAEHVAAWENETDVESLEDQERKRVYVSLYQTHVPKLADAGLVDYDKEAGTVALAPGATAVDEYLSQPENGVSWQLIYLAEALVGGVTLALTAFDVGAFGLLPQTVVSLIILIVFTGTAIAQVIYNRQRESIPPELRLGS